jgi:Protein of unknown function (DUF3037)
MPAAARDPFQYALLRVVPDLERGEALNAGVVLFCRRRAFLAARVHLDERRLVALAPQADADAIAGRLDDLARIAAGDPAAGPVARLDASERFGWLTAPASTVVQPSAVHTGLCEDPEAMLDRLFARLVT